MNNSYVILQIVIMAVITALLRFLPFIIFTKKDRETPKFIAYLGDVLPMAIMGMLVIYCLKGTTFAVLSGWLPALIAIVALVLVHIWKRNTLLSILTGTVIYMVLVQII